MIAPRTLYTIAYPKLGVDDAEQIAKLRRTHDPQHKIVGPHFTLLFGSTSLPASHYLQHVQDAIVESGPIEFVCRSAMLGSHGSLAYVYLIPDEGFSALSLLHEKLYGGAMAVELRLDIPFFPHITVAAMQDQQEAKRLCDELNERGILILGRIEAVTVVAKEPESLRELKSFLLRAG